MCRKPATLETGKIIQVPFSSRKESIKVDTRTGAYLGALSSMRSDE
jgi:hypothetical protein